MFKPDLTVETDAVRCNYDEVLEASEPHETFSLAQPLQSPTVERQIPVMTTNRQTGIWTSVPVQCPVPIRQANASCLQQLAWLAAETPYTPVQMRTPATANIPLECGDEVRRRMTFLNAKMLPIELRKRIVCLSYDGFYYTGMEDMVKCFSCGLALKFFEPKDNIIDLHFNNSGNQCRHFRKIHPGFNSSHVNMYTT